MTTETGVEGYAPRVIMQMDERTTYEKLWSRDEYRRVAPGEECVNAFLQQAHPIIGSQVIDFGAGTGRAARTLANSGLKVHMLDFAENCLDADVKAALGDSLEFSRHDLTLPIPVMAQYGYCTDVMEHIPPRDVVLVLQNILKAARHVFFQISCEDDVLGAIVGRPLHLSVHPHDWWLEQFKAMDCFVQWSEDRGSACLFYVTAWTDGQVIVDGGELNVAELEIKANVLANVSGGKWQQVIPYATNELEVMILGGGPTLGEHLETIRKMRADGVKLITLNGAYNWALDNGLIPSATIVVDAREFNNRFTHPPVADCLYLLASQCHPSVYEGLPPDQVWQWHTSAPMIKDILEEHLGAKWFDVPGGSTVLLRAIPLLRMLGYYKFHLFGCDSCVRDKEHHTYSQPENDERATYPVAVGGRVFHCHPWMIAQAQEWINIIKLFGSHFDAEIYGDGLLRHIVETGASLIEEGK